MTKHIMGHNRAIFDGLHPALYKAMVGLAIWFAVSAWMLFDDSGYISLILAIITLLFLIAILIPVALWRTWRRHPEVSGDHQELSVPFHDWTAGTFETWQCRIRGSEAAVQVLLPIMAVAFGLTAIGVVLHFVGASAGAA